MIFHLIIVNAVTVIAESFYSDTNSNRKDNTYLEDDNGGNAHSTTDCEEDKYVLEAWKKHSTMFTVQSLRA
jgi:hypothetical protein